MIAMTNCEEIAKKLREVSTARTTDEVYVALLNCIGITYDYANLFNRLADLINPTCTADIKREDDGIDAQPYYTSSCGNCGALWDTITGAALLPKYCPHCGARVVR